jgi:hypothetical protein
MIRCSLLFPLLTLVVALWTSHVTTAFSFRPARSFVASPTTTTTTTTALANNKGFGASEPPKKKPTKKPSVAPPPPQEPEPTAPAPPPPMNAGQKALADMRRGKAEQRDNELRRVRDMISEDKQVQEMPAAIPERVAERMGKRMLPFVGLPLFLGMGSFVAFWYFATYKDVGFEPAIVAGSTILILVFGLLVRVQWRRLAVCLCVCVCVQRGDSLCFCFHLFDFSSDSI